MNRNGSSVDFPFILQYEKDYKTKASQLSQQQSRNISMRDMTLNSYTNENMDLFRLEFNKENTIGYHNKFLDHIKPIDRNQAFKEGDKVREKIYLIDLLKSNRKLSQEPRIFRKIISNDESKILNQRQMMLSLIKDRNTIKIPIDKDKINSLYHHYNPNKISPVILSNINISKSTCNNEKMQHYYSLAKYPPSYLSNYNDYSIEEAQSMKEDKFIKYRLKGSSFYNLFNEQTKEFKGGEISFPKWSSFYENYLQVKDDGFSRRGGEFSEFIKMHPDIIKKRQKNIDKIKEERLNNVNKSNIFIPYSREQSAKNRVKYTELLKEFWNGRRKMRNNKLEYNAIVNNPLRLSKSERNIKSREAMEIIKSRNLFKLQDIYHNKY